MHFTSSCSVTTWRESLKNWFCGFCTNWKKVINIFESSHYVKIFTYQTIFKDSLFSFCQKDFSLQLSFKNRLRAFVIKKWLTMHLLIHVVCDENIEKLRFFATILMMGKKVELNFSSVFIGKSFLFCNLYFVKRWTTLYNQEKTMQFFSYYASRMFEKSCYFWEKIELNFSSREREATKGNFSMFLSLFVQGKENNPMWQTLSDM